MSTGVFDFLALFYSDLLAPQKLQRITGATTVQRQALFLLEPRKTRRNTISICLPTSSDNYFYFFIGKSSTFIWKWNKWQTFQPPGAPSCGQESKAGQPDECLAKASWRGVKKTLLKTGPPAFKESAISERSSRGSRGLSVPLARKSKREATMPPREEGGGGGGLCRWAPDPVVLPSGVNPAVPSMLNSQPNCHSWHSTQPLQAHNLCSYGS